MAAPAQTDDVIVLRRSTRTRVAAGWCSQVEPVGGDGGVGAADRHRAPRRHSWERAAQREQARQHGGGRGGRLRPGRRPSGAAGPAPYPRRRVNHARFGWKLVAEVAPSLDAATRERLGRYLAVALPTWRNTSRPCHGAGAERGSRGLGLCDTRRTRAFFYETAERVIVPGPNGWPAGGQAWSDRERGTAAEPRRRLRREPR